MSFTVLRKGFYTTVQDLGRHGYRQYGVVRSGAMDSFAMQAANLLVGNERNAAVLEATLLGPKLRCERSVLVAVCGGEAEMLVNGNPAPLWRPVLLAAGDVLQFGVMRSGCRLYIAAAGGVDVPEAMGSRSTYVRAGIGGYKGRALQDGDVLELGTPSTLAQQLEAGGRTSWGVSPYARPAYNTSPVIRVMRGAQYDCFTEESKRQFFNGSFQVTAASDRMGYRLEGRALTLQEPLELLSEAVTFGTVQVPPEGKPIVLMADCQTTGGYPKLAAVATVDLPLLAQVKPGESVRFQEIAVEEAQRLLQEQEQALKELETGIKLKGRSQHAVCGFEL
ncbi:biotin-dependent carboxyltransferase family protein [Ectobacillus ponti]|uniref:Biotin-dependent carboxyltransferase family protein n=1 Tax=Ectobacillus ponti TaxID=2961894 RepID=A0AA41X7R7_9BACI|nr:biotin-dependent carboxyltransferase family protein [Ectobacillus ponti]MCP8970476.1 biotin-dependent carboxyltransferase family protein [Ectobacillus ponti]